MIRHALICLGFLSCVLMASPALAQNPTHACPHFTFSNDGTVYQWYSGYLHKDVAGCHNVTWGPYAGGAVEPTGGDCSNIGNCRALGRAETEGSTRIVPASREVAKSGLAKLPEPDFEPTLGEMVTVMDKRIVDVMITPTKVIKVKLYLQLVDPRVLGNPQPPILVPTGFEVRYDANYPPFMTIDNGQIERLSENLYIVKIGEVEYLITTHQEG